MMNIEEKCCKENKISKRINVEELIDVKKFVCKELCDMLLFIV